MPTIEVEVKLPLQNPDGMAARLSEAGARLLHPREFEDNRLYDFPDRSLLSRGAMLRVRVTDRVATLTYKDRARTEDRVKVREEIETELPPSGAPRLVETLERIGMVPIFQYQKYRTTWESGDLLITVDETPIGFYLEIEGARDAIDRLAARLGYSPEDYIPQSYRDLYVQALSHHPGPADRMIFDDHSSGHRP